jgi:3-phosphoshikimate 1-carboxyvinyltransferase
LLNRPIENIVETLTKLGVDIKSNEGKLPLQINGKLQATEIEIDGSLGSQLLTGLLIALPLLEGDSKILVKNLKSKAYIDMTLAIMKKFGAKVINNNYQEFIIKGNQKYRGRKYSIEGDWSGAAFLLVAGAISNKTEVENIDTDSQQADKKILDALELAGAKITINENSVLVEKNQLNAFDFDATHCPDLFPPLVSLAAMCKGTTKILGVNRLIHKESNRAKTLQQEFTKMGINIKLQDDLMFIEGGKIKSATIDSHNDHRIAMAGYLFNILPNVNIEILNKNAVNKSYPGFYDILI